MAVRLLILFLTFCAFPAMGWSQVVINEIQSSNNTTISDEDGHYEDWIELYNTGVDTIHIGWHSLTDDPQQPFQWIIPPGTRIAPGEYLMIWASGKDRRNPDSQLHSNFSIAQEGEEVLLTDLQGQRLDSVSSTRIPSDMSYGRYPDGTADWHFFDTPSPAISNADPKFSDQLSEPAFSHEGGFYSTPFYLKLSSQHNAALHYTLDGSVPDRNDPVWPDSLEIGARESTDHLLSYIRTNPPEAEQYGWKKPSEPPFLATVVRVKAFRENAMPSKTATHTFFVTGESGSETGDINNNQSKYSLPVVSLVTDSLHLFDHEEGIYIPGKRYEDHWFNPPWGSPYANYFYTGKEWERPASFEFFEPEQGRVFHQDIGIRIHGGMSRALPHKSLRLYARSEYGDTRFEYPFFDHPDSHPEHGNSTPDTSQNDLPSYNRLILRNSGQDFYRASTMFRDAMTQGLVNHLNIDTQAYRPAILFINGEFWGISNMRERYDKHYLSRTYNIDPERIDFLSGRFTVTEGSREHYQSYRNYIEEHDITDSTHYAHINKQLDIDNFLDYNITNIYVNNWDWPGNNREFFRYQTEYDPDAAAGRDGRWRYLLIDTDYGFGHQRLRDDAHHDMLSVATGTPSDKAPNPSWATVELSTLLDNPDFRHQFITRFANYLNTFLSPDYVLEHIEHYADLIEPVIEKHINRWNYPPRITGWQSQLDVMRYFAEKRPSSIRKHMMDYFDLNDTVQVTLDIEGEPRSGYITINETAINGQTRGVDSNPYPWNGIYFSDAPVDLTAVPRNGYRFAGWKEYPESSDTNLRITPGDDATITAVFEKDGKNEYKPKPFELSDGTFQFDEWSSDAPAGTYPDHMVFQYMDRKHPDTEAWVAGDVNMAYNRESGTRLIGLGDDGIAMINSSNEADTTDFHENRLGAVILGLRTVNHGQITVNWTAGTVLSNSRDYAIRLEYRVGDEGAFSPVLDERNLPVIYKRQDEDGHSRSIGPVRLPEETEDQPYVQLLWRYYDAGELPVQEDEIPAMLRIDEVSVSSNPVSASAEPDTPNDFKLAQNYPNPFNQQTRLPFDLPRAGRVTVTVFSIDGREVAHIDAGYRQAGKHTLPIQLEGWASGVYIVRMHVQSGAGRSLYTGTRQMTLLK